MIFHQADGEKFFLHLFKCKFTPHLWFSAIFIQSDLNWKGGSPKCHLVGDAFVLAAARRRRRRRRKRRGGSLNVFTASYPYSMLTVGDFECTWWCSLSLEGIHIVILANWNKQLTISCLVFPLPKTIFTPSLTMSILKFKSSSKVILFYVIFLCNTDQMSIYWHMREEIRSWGGEEDNWSRRRGRGEKLQLQLTEGGRWKK